ncbi:hypothetical protein ACGC1H_003069 [Rhizoctonia solani]|uniref:F-box domain-containing protein n=1 Tax=Rhizoctonia solani TaxID=456999 RepID=A0A8H3GXP1_9AGAM|nr:unnamed protein product [Rhizoctonia solani]
MTLNAQKALLPPEITQQIASYCGYREQRDLAYTCRWLFSSVTPVIWKEVHGVEIVFKLITGVKVTKGYTPNEGDHNIFKDIIFDESLLDVDWARYWYYAPFIHHITLFSGPEGDTDANLHVSGWRFLFMKLQGSVLLPNLRSLNTQGLYFASHFDCLAWIVLLLSPSLQKLNLDDVAFDLGLSPPTMRPLSLFLGAVSNSLLVDSSRIIATQDEWHPSEQTLASLFPSEYPEGSFWFSNLSAPAGLRDLEITLLSPSTLWDELYIIGSLPLLVQLQTTFCMEGFTNEAKYNLSVTPLPSSLFPSLRTLNLKGASHIDLFHWLWRLKPMVSGLSSAHINVPDFGSNRQWLAVNFAQLIHDNSPNLIDLSINLNPASNEMGALEIACELLSTVPLQALTFDWFFVRAGDYTTTHSNSTFYHLRRLNISATFHPSDWAILPKIAKAFPNLEHLGITLSIQLESYEPLAVGCINHMTFQPIDIDITLYCYENSPISDEEQWKNIRNDITNFLKSIWSTSSIAIDSSHPYYYVLPDSTAHSPATTVQDEPVHVPADDQAPTRD